jgi:RHS repeat-associated protein
VLIVLGVLALVVRADNPCTDQIVYMCDFDGSVATAGTLTSTNLNVCAGGTLTPPGFAINPTFNSGEVSYSHTCYPNENGVLSCDYTAGGLYFVPNNLAWPPITGPFNTAGTYTYTAKVNGYPGYENCDVITDVVATVFVVVSNSLPVIITQPTNQTVALGDNAAFSILASGCPSVTYQWYFNTNTLLTGKTGTSLILPNVQMTNAGHYSVVVSDYSGSVTSSQAVLTVVIAPCTQPPSGLVSWWPGDDNASDIAGTNNGILEGPMRFTNGEVGYAFVFNNTNAFIKIPASASLNVGTNNGTNSGFTIEGWIDPSDVAVDHAIAEWNNGTNYWGVHFHITQDSGPGSLYANVVDSGGSWHQMHTPTAPVITNEFQHVALTYDKSSGVSTIYYDGLIAARQTLGTFTPSTAFDLYLGRRVSETPGDSFVGLMDEMSLYKRALTSNEIAAIYLAGSSGKCTTCYPVPSGIAAWWPAESNTVDVISGNVGVVTNGTIGYAPAEVGLGFNFNGGPNRLIVPDSPSLDIGSNVDFTIESWIRAAPTNPPEGIMTIADKRYAPNSVQCQGYEVCLFNGQVNLRISDNPSGNGNSWSAGPNLLDGQLHHVAVSVARASTNGGDLYVDGTNILQFDPTSVKGDLTTSQPLRIGNHPDPAYTAFFNGQIDELSIYKRALSSNEIAGIYLAGSDGKCPETNSFYANGPTNVTTCEGEPVSFSVTAGDCSPIAYQWEFRTNTLTGQTNSSLNLTNVYVGSSGTYSVIVSSPCGNLTNSATLTVLTNLAVAGPEDLSVCTGGTAVFGVTAFGTGPFSYQWSFGTNIMAGQTNSTLTISNVNPTSVGEYSIMVSGACGTVIHSAVLSTLSIVGQPGDQTVTYGQSATFSVSAAGYGSPAYQWQRNGTNIPGANASFYTVVQPTVAQSGAHYDVIVSIPNCTLVSSNATLVVNPAPLLVSADDKARPFGTTNPLLTWTATGFVNGDTSGVLSGNPTLSCAATTNNPVGNYTISISQGTLYGANYLLSFSNGVLTVGQAVLDITADNQSRQYGLTNPPLTWTPTGFLNGDTSAVLSGTPTVTTTATTNSPVGNYPIIISQSTLSCTNYSFLFSNGVFTVSQAPLSVTASNQFKITGSPNPTLTGLLTSVRNNDNITATYSTSATTTSPAGTYPIVPILHDPTTKLPNYNVTTNVGTLTVTDAPVALSGPPATLTKNAGDTMSIGVVASGTSPFSYQWYFNGNAIPGATSSNYTKLVVQQADQGSYWVVVANSRGNVTSSSCTLTVNVAPIIIQQPTNQIVPQGFNATFIVQATGTPTPSYQWQSNGVNIAGATSSSYSTPNPGTYSVIVANSAGSAASLSATLSDVSVSANGIIVNGSNPVITGSGTNFLGTVNLQALSNPSGVSFPSGYPIWITSPPNGAGSITNYGPAQLTVANSVAGQYRITASCGTNQAASFNLLSVDPNADSDYDGVNDWQEILDGTDPNNPTNVAPRALGTWLFDDTNTWLGLQQQKPLVVSNIVGCLGVSSNGMRINSPNPAILAYRESETNSSVANINCRQGTVTFWFSPDWNSGATGGPKTGEARLFEFGTKGNTNYGCWGLYLNNQGTNIYFCTQTNKVNSVPQTNLITQINWSSNYWHFIALTYNATNCSLYLDGALCTNGLGVANWPSFPVRNTNGLCIGSCRNGTNQACGRYDNFGCHNYCQNSNDIDITYSGACFSYVDVMLTIDTSGSMGEKTSPTNNNTKLQDAKIAATNFISHLNFQADRAGLVTFSNLSHLVLTLTSTNSMLDSAILSLTNNGSTAIDTGISNAMKVLIANHNSNALPVMVLMTDGSNDPVSTYPITNIYKEAITAKNIGIRLVTVALGTNADAADLRNIASPPATNNFYDVTNSGLLLQIYNSIADVLCRTNESPIVSIDSPTNYQIFDARSPVPIYASAFDPESELQQVEFLWGHGTNLQTATNVIGGVNFTNYGSYYYIQWTNSADLTNTLLAVAMSASGLSATSAPVYIIVNEPPQISGLTNPYVIWPDNPTNVDLTAIISDDGMPPNGHLGETWTFQGGNGSVTLLNPNTTDATAEFLTNGMYYFVLTASDGLASTTNYCTVTIRQRPFVFITSPTNNASINCSNAQIEAITYDYDTTVPSNGVAIWDITNGTSYLLGTATENPGNGITNCYLLDCTNNLSPGTNTLYAIATDNYGLTNVSPLVTVIGYEPVSVSISQTNPTPCAGSSVTFTATVSGTGPLTYSWLHGSVPLNVTTNPLTLASVTTNDSGNYRVFVSNPYGTNSASSNLTVEATTSAVGPTNEMIYSGGTAYFATTPLTGVPPFIYQWYSNSVLLSDQTGPTLTVTNATINAVYSVSVNGASCGGVTNSATLTMIPPPTIYIVQPANNVQETAFASLQLMSVVTDQATVTNVVYSTNGISFATNGASPYLLNLSGLPPGTYVFQATAYDNAGRIATSPTVTNVVNKSTPFVQIFEPLTNSQFVAGQNIQIGARATDSGGTITSVQFQVEGETTNVISTNDLYYCTWTNASLTAPNYTNILAIAIDDQGSKATSVVSVVVEQPCAAPEVSNLILSTNLVTGGDVLTGTVFLSSPAIDGGQTITLSNNSPFVVIPEFLYVPEGQSTSAFVISTLPPSATNYASISAMYHGQAAVSAVLTNLPPPSGGGPNGSAVRPGFDTNALDANDDGYVGPVDIGFPILYYSEQYTNLWVDNNGIVTFGAGWSDFIPIIPIGEIRSVDGFFNADGTPLPAIAPFWADVDTRGGGSGLTRYGTNTVNGHSAFGVTWDNVGYYNGHTDLTNRFQVVLIDRDDTGLGNFDIEFNYERIKWETGDVSYYEDSDGNPIEGPYGYPSGGFGGAPARFGYGSGLGDGFELPGSGISGALVDTNTGGVFGNTNILGLIHTNYNSPVLGRYIFQIRSAIGTANGQTVFVRDDGTRQSGAFSATGPNTGAAASILSRFDTVGVQGDVTNAELLRRGDLAITPGSHFDFEFGAASRSNTASSFGPLFEGAQQIVDTNYSADWNLGANFCEDIESQLAGEYYLRLTNRVTSICGNSYTITDTPQSSWPWNKNILTFSVVAERKIPAGRCRDFVLDGVNAPVNGTWEIRFRNHIIASSGLPNGWDVEEDYTSFGGFTVTAPSNAVADNGYEVRVLQIGWFSGRSATFSVLPAGSISSAPTLLPMQVSKQFLTPPDVESLTVSLDSPAPFGDAYVPIYTNGVPAFVLIIPAGQTAAVTNVPVGSVGSGSLEFFASYNGYRKSKVQIVANGCTRPDPVTNPTAVSRPATILITWDPEPGVTGYDIARSTNGTDYTPLFDGLLTTNFVDTETVSPIMYTYQIIAVSNSCESDPAYTSAQAQYSIQMPPPSIIPFGGILNDQVTVLLTNDIPNTTIFYTTDGTTPTTQSPSFGNNVNGGVITLNSNAVVEAFSTNSYYYYPSPLVFAPFTIVHPTSIDCGSNISSSLSAADSFSTVQGEGYFCSRYIFTNSAAEIGQVVTLNALSSDFYTALYVRDDSTNILYANYDSLENGTNSQIVYQITSPGTNIIEVTSCFPWEIGDFTLTMDCENMAGLNVFTNAWRGLQTNYSIFPIGGTLDFGSIPLGVPRTNFVTLTNSGTTDLIISNIAVYPNAISNATDGFTIAPSSMIDIPGGGITNLAISLYATNLSTYSGYFIFNDNDGSLLSQNPFWANLTGEVGANPGAPFVTIYYPTNGQTIDVTNGSIALVTLELDASVVDTNAITNFIYTNASFTVTASRGSSGIYTVIWTNPPAGVQVIQAIATDSAGHSGTNSVTINVGTPSLILTPTNPCVGLLNTTYDFAATLLDYTNGFVNGSNVTFTVTGANSISVTNSTASPNGQAPFSYQGTNSGADRITASAAVAGVPVQAGPIIMNWAAPISCGNTYPGRLTNSSGFSMTDQVHYADYYSFTGSSGDVVRVEMASPDFSTYMFIITNCVVVTNVPVEALNTSNTLISYTLPYTGTYIVEATSSDLFKTGNYSLSLSCGAIAEPQMEAYLSGTNFPNYSLLNFGSTVTNVAVTNTLVITNAGTTNLNITGWSLYNGQTNIFWPLNPILTTVAPGQSTNIAIQFMATNSGQYQDALILANDDPYQNPFVVNLAGIVNTTNIAPTVSITSPTNGASFLTGNSFNILANAVPGGSANVTNVSFIFRTTQGAYLIGAVTNPVSGTLYSVSWSFPTAGNYSLQAYAFDDDGGIAVSAPVSITVNPSILDHPPVWKYAYVTVMSGSKNDVLDVLTNDSDPDGDPLTITAIVPSTTPQPHGTATIVDGGKHISYTPPPGEGSPDPSLIEDGFSYRISDGRGGTTLAGVYVSIFAAPLPGICLTNTPSVTNANSLVPIVAYVDPSQYVTNVTFYQGQTPIGTVTTGVNGFYTNYWIAVDNSCGCGFSAQAQDMFGQINTSPEISITVLHPGGSGFAPVATLDSYTGYNDPNTSGTLAPSTDVMQSGATIEAGIFNIYGTATNSQDGAAVTWSLGLYSSDGSTLLRTIVAQSSTTVAPGGFLATCDLTTIQNGPYQLRLSVSSDGYETQTSAQISLNSNLKLGEFSFSQKDLVIPVNGIPLTVTRTYNSINPNSSDFGYGWTFAINSMDVQLDETRENISLEPVSSGTANIRSGGGRDVALTLPDGRRVVFNASLVSGSGQDTEGLSWNAVWSAPGVTAKLTTLAPAQGDEGDLGDNSLVTLPSDPVTYWQDGGGQQSTMDNYDMPGWILTTPDQTQYYITRGSGRTVNYLTSDGLPQVAKVYGTPKLTKIVEHSGDSVQIGNNNITHYDSAGHPTASIQFDRDTQGRIIAIHDPTGGANGFPAVKYEYDTLGNLAHVEKLIDRNVGTYVTNSYNYTSSQFPHYITSMLNGDGTQVAQSYYDDSGKLSESVDADGNITYFNSNPSNNTQTVVDRLGDTNLFIYDSRGNVLSQTDPLGHATSEAYDANNNVIQSVDPLGNTNTFAYDANNNRTMAADSMNHTNLYVYNPACDLTNAINPLGDAMAASYDQNGNLLQSVVQDPNGNVIAQASSTYNNGLLTSMQNASGQAFVSFGYDPSSDYLTSVKSADGATGNFAYDACGNQTNCSYIWTAPDGSQVTLTNLAFFDAQNRVTMTIDEYGNTNQTFYDLNGHLSYTIDRYGNTNSFLYDARGDLIAASNALGTVTYTVYDSAARPILNTDPNGITGTLMEYDADGRATNMIRLENVRVNLVLDPNASGQMATVVASLGTGLSTNSTTYYPNGWTQSQTSPDGTTTYTYWPNGQTETVTDPLNHTTTYAYTASGLQSLVWDANNHGTRFVYDAVGRMVSTIYDDHTSVSNIFNSLGQHAGTVDQNGLLTQFNYNLAGKMTNVMKSQLAAGIPSWFYQYDTNGQLAVTTDPLGHSTTNFYDPFGHQISQALPMGQTNISALYTKGLLWKQYDFMGQMIEHHYDNFGRETNKAYFATGATAGTAASYAVSYAYNQLNQLTNVTQFYGSSASQFVATLNPNGAGLPMSAKLVASLNRYPGFSAGATILFMLGMAMAMIPAQKRRRFILAVGDEVTRLKSGCQVATQRRPIGKPRLRMPSIFWRFISPIALLAMILSEPGYYELCTAQAQCYIPNNYSTSTVHLTSFTYDVEGNLSQVNSPEGVINYSYDLATGRMTSLCTANSEQDYSYDALGRLQTVTVVRRNGATLITPETTTYAYDPVGNRSSVRLPNGVVTAYQYDDLNRLTNMAHTAQAGALLANYAYQLDPTGRRTNAVEVLQQEGGTYQTNSLTWQFDPMYRLTNEICICSASSASYTNSYVYDLAGNRTHKTSLGQSTDNAGYTYDNNDELLSESSTLNGITSYLYDGNGSLTNKASSTETLNYAYNVADQLSSVTSGWNTTAYRYDQNGIRVESVTGGVPTEYLVDARNHTGFEQVLEELPSLGAAPRRSYVIGDDVLAQADGSGNVSYLLQDGHGSTRQLMGGGSVSSVYNFDAYGQSLGAKFTPVNLPATPMLFAGQQFDVNAQQYYQRARYYDPANGRFNQRDTYAGSRFDPQSIHKYLYCGGDPVNVVDPSGRDGLVGLMVDMAIDVAIDAMDFTSSMLEFNEVWKTLQEINDLINPAREVNPSQVPAFDKQMARLCNDVYTEKPQGAPPWLPTNPNSIGVDPSIFSSGSFVSQLYDEGNNNDYALAFRGTMTTGWSDIIGDWYSNVMQALYGPLVYTQYDEAVDVADQVNSKLGNSKNLTMTGHSLGGGLAAVAALSTDRPAVTFNAAGVNGLTFIADGGLFYNNRINNYSVEGEVLTTLQRNMPIMPEALGQQYFLPVIKADQSKSPIGLHGMDTVLDSLGEGPNTPKPGS